MKVLIACEFSGIVRDAFLVNGHDAMSCDLEDSERPGPHYQGDVEDILGDGWDLMIAHPPCTHLAVSGARHFARKQESGVQEQALKFVRILMSAPIGMIAIENPISIISTRIRKPDQIIQPWQFGHAETKATCLWLSGLPPLIPTCVVEPTENRIWKMPGGKNQAKNRSRSYDGIAHAMAEQWGGLRCD